MELKPGMRLRSQVCATQVIVVKAPAGDVDVRCGGAPMVSLDVEIADGGTPEVGSDTGTQLGKRYVDQPGDSLELLVTQPGAGTLALDAVVLALKDAKPLPSSD